MLRAARPSWASTLELKGECILYVLESKTMTKVEVGKVYRQLGGGQVLVVRDVPKNEYRASFVNPLFEYVEVVDALRLDLSHGWRRKHDGKYPLYAEWDQHPNHLVLNKEQ